MPDLVRTITALGARHHRAPDPRLGHLTTGKAPHAIALQGAARIGPALQTVMPGWGLTVVPDAAPPDMPASTIRQSGPRHYEFRSWWGGAPLTGMGLAGATCGAVADLCQSYCDNRPGILGLHCGAVRIGTHLVAFTGPYRAGKTTLVTRLGADPDVTLFCDDVLPVLPDGQAVALGIQPRLRLPLPGGMSPAFRRHVARNLTIRDRRYGYVRTLHQAPHGTRAPLTALIVLSRQDDGPARLHHMQPGDAAAHLIRQNLADPGETETHYDRLAAMVERLFCLTLVYSDLEDAVALIRRTFDSARLPAPGIEIGPPLPPAPLESPAPAADLRQTFHRAQDVTDRVIGGDTFLWQMAGRNFFRLNPVAGAAWTLLECSTTGARIAATLTEVFPDTPPERISGDLADLLGHMMSRDLIRATNR
ncbi:PqqD family protein [Roseovarius azorensis]|nr:PqqD family protein [Roseovarius azorensis]